MSSLPLNLAWLPAAPENFKDQCRSLSAQDAQVGMAIQILATHALNAAQATMLSRAVARVQKDGASLAPLTRLRLGVLPSATYDFVVAGLPAAGARHGMLLDVRLFPADQVETIALDRGSALFGGDLDVVFVAIDDHWLGLDRPALDRDPGERVAAALARLREVVTAIAGEARATPIVPTIAAPASSLFGSFDRRAPGSPRSMIDAFNAALPDLCAETGALLFDVGALAELVGTAAWRDAAMYNLYKLPFTPEAVPLYCDGLARLAAALRGKARKCLVLDLDNTCWGGVVGDDGWGENLKLSPGSAEGESFLSVQKMALDLKSRGVILAVCSKNEDETARTPFRNHPDMLLKEADIAVFQANWSDKPSNLESIARTLEIGLDALVLLDDNGAERAMVRRALPMVAVPELPGDPALYAETLLAAGYFEAVSFSDEDRSRADSYAANAQRAEVMSRSRDLGDYLSSLEMRIEHRPFSAVNRARIAQLINKSNQFNLTTRRYTEAQIAELENGASGFTLQTRLGDRYGDLGIIGVVIAKEAAEGEEAAWELDTWLMSCRVLGRRVEEAMLAELAAAAGAAGVKTLIGRYIPTAKNGIVMEHYDKLGFDRACERPDGAREYRLSVGDFTAPLLPFTRD